MDEQLDWYIDYRHNKKGDRIEIPLTKSRRMANLLEGGNHETWCEHVYDGWTCTRKTGHQAPHVATSAGMCSTWKD